MVRHFLRDDDLTPDELHEILELGTRVKADRLRDQSLAGPRTVAVLFDKSSTRTRVSFSVAISELGGYPLVLDAQSSQMGRGESIADTARVLDRQCAAIVWRTFGQERIEEMAAHSSVPVINALTDEFHPCQLLADLMTVRERFGALAGLTTAYLGDGGNNMAHSWLLAGANAGMNVRIATPAAYPCDVKILTDARELAKRRGVSIEVTDDPKAAATGADILITDTWVSMGDEAEKAEREKAFAGYTVDQAMVDTASNQVMVLHCLPAYRGKEITAEVIDGPHSAVWDEAENRLHAQKALLIWLLRQHARPASLS